jgi:hypothetical protein
MILRFMKKAKRTPRRKLKGKGSRPTARRYRRSSRFKSSKPGTYVIENGTITWRLPRKLRSLNAICTKLARYGDTKAWETQFTTAELKESDGSLGPCSKQRLRLEIWRLSPSKAFFLDPTNRAGGAKGLEDALVRLEYLVDDCDEWLDGPYVHNDLSDDGKYMTVVKLSVIPYGA